MKALPVWQPCRVGERPRSVVPLAKGAKFGAEDPEAGRVEPLGGRPSVIEARVNPVWNFPLLWILPRSLTWMKILR